jgi:translation initiation factor 4E
VRLKLFFFAIVFQVLACIGEDFVDSDEICGCVVSLRKAYDRIALWIRISDDEQVIRRIGQRFKEHLGQTNLKFSFEAHNDAKQYFRRDRKSKFEL